MAEFGGEPEVQLVPGSLRGARAFKLSASGALTGVFHEQMWGEGENVATCYGASYHYPGLAGIANCSCGFYAYFHATTVHHAKPNTVLGIVEGYGRTTFGYSGFRSSKAKILAIYNPYLPARVVQVGLLNTRFPRLHRVWLNVQGLLLSFYLTFTVLLVYFVCLGLTELWVTKEPWYTILVTIRWTAWIFWLTQVVAQTVHAIRSYRWKQKKVPKNQPPHLTLAALLQYAKLSMKLRQVGSYGFENNSLDAGEWAQILTSINSISSAIAPSRFDMLRRRYPDVPIYGDLEQMLRDFPPTSRAELDNIGETT